MLALERLSPLERAALLLHDVFGLGFEEIAETIRREAAACRQLANRARTNVRAARPRFDIPRCRGSAAWRSLWPSSPLPAAAIRAGCTPCWPLTSAFMPMMAQEAGGDEDHR